MNSIAMEVSDVRYEEWSVRSEQEILLLRVLGATLLPKERKKEKRIVDPRHKIDPMTPYYVTVDFTCTLCHSKYSKVFHMQQKSGMSQFLASTPCEEVPAAAEDVRKRSEKVPACKFCQEALADTPVEELIEKLMKLSTTIGI
jgi:hypothetical protein